MSAQTLFIKQLSWSSQANLILSVEAGLKNSKYPVNPFSSLALLTASLIAKNTEDARNNGGSPIA